MTVQFMRYPASTNRVPGVFIEVDPSKANTGQVNLRTIIIGQIQAGGFGGLGSTLVPGVPVICQGVAWTQQSAGLGSMLALQVAKYREGDTFGEVWVLPLVDDGQAVAATGGFALAGTATATGVLSMYVAGQLVSTRVASGTTAAQAVAAAQAVIAAGGLPNLPVTSTVTGGSTLTLTARNAGLCGNDIDLRMNYLCSRGGEATPPGMTVTITPMAGGLLNPSLTTALLNLADEPFDYICLPYTDTASLTAVMALLDDATGRWAWSRMIYGHAFAAYRGTIGGQTTFGVTRNDQHVSIMGFNDSPTPSWLWSAALTATCASSLRVDPALPLNPDSTTILHGVMAPPVPSRFVLSDRNTLLYDGISTYNVDSGGNVTTERVVTTYQKTAAGAPDDSYLNVETMATLAYVLRDLRTYLRTQYARKRLVSDATRTAGNNMVSPSDVKAAVISRYRVQEVLGFVQNSSVFAAALVVEPQGRGQLAILWPADIVPGLRSIGILAQFVQTT